jgi:hypothetical protein
MAWARVISSSQILGPAIIKAFILEQYKADYPRIVVGDDLVHFLDDVCQIESGRAPKEYIDCAKMCRALLSKDEDGLYVVDYLGAPFTSFVTRQGAGLLLPAARNFIESEFEKYKDGRDIKLLRKYERLHSYLVSRLRT